MSVIISVISHYNETNFYSGFFFFKTELCMNTIYKMHASGMEQMKTKSMNSYLYQPSKQFI